ncbi:hypothetical protein SNEBB_008136 [Seison nebaliae]|nr:hypothetical protein SNEBB_008136 [Seison nebaliae]
MSIQKICVVGGGIVGLSTALAIQMEFNKFNLFQSNKVTDRPKVKITLISKGFNEETTSFGAAGLCRPDDRFICFPKHFDLFGTLKKSFKFYDDIYHSSFSNEAGVCLISGYQIYEEERHNPIYKDLVPHFRMMEKNEMMKIFPKTNCNFGSFMTTYLVDPPKYLKFLKNVCEKAGTEFIVDDVRDLGELRNFDLIINCSGIGIGGWEKRDEQTIPIRGQMVRIEAPWVKHFFYVNDDTYIIPTVDNVAIGGTRQRGNSNSDIDQTDHNDIMKRVKGVLPSLENSKEQWKWVGLRPHRNPIRLEKENHIIHAYGLGGNGICLSWGITQIIINMMNEMNEISNKFDDSLNLSEMKS